MTKQDDYIQLHCVLSGSNEMSEVITAFLAELGFEMFEDIPDGLMAYIPTVSFSELDIQKLTNDFAFSYSFVNIPSQNWNEVWEKNFPILIHGDIFSVRAPFHPIPENVRYNLIIEPDMSFGTGHHQTTFMMLQEILNFSLTNKSVLDMGAGTGILSIMASMLGAKEITAVENNERSMQNIHLNIKHNASQNINVLHGSVECLADKKFDLILANINRNILKEQMENYAKSLNKDGSLILSGFLIEDIPIMIESAMDKGFRVYSKKIMDQWALLICVK